MSLWLRAIVEKDGMYGVLGLLAYNDTFLLTSKDDRTPQPYVLEEKDKVEAQKKFDEGLATTRDRGWAVIFYGQPNNFYFS